MYNLWFEFLGLFLRRRCVVVLKTGQRIAFLRPKGMNRNAFTKEVQGWVTPAGHRIFLMSAGVETVVMSDDVLYFTIR